MAGYSVFKQVKVYLFQRCKLEYVCVDTTTCIMVHVSTSFIVRPHAISSFFDTFMTKARFKPKLLIRLVCDWRESQLRVGV